jgi:hypothetical protein
LYLRVRGLANNHLDVQQKVDTHMFQALHWKLDISVLTQDQVLYMAPPRGDASRLDGIVDLVAQKTPRLSVLEIAVDDACAAEPLWLHGRSEYAATWTACAGYDFATPEVQTLVAVQSAHVDRWLSSAATQPRYQPGTS